MSEIIVSISEEKKRIEILDGNRVRIDDVIHDVALSKLSNYLYLLKLDEKVYEITTDQLNNEDFLFFIDGRQINATARTALQEKAYELLKKQRASSSEDLVKAPMPGLLLKILKKEGEQVELGEPLLVLEAMKMENEIRSPAAGIVKDIKYREGASVEKDAEILKIE